jgi:NADPH-dependent curcumin reductase CurA
MAATLSRATVGRFALRTRSVAGATSSQSRGLSTRVVLASRPAVNSAVTTDNFRVESLPESELAEASPSGVIAETLYLSVDPFLRCRFNEDTGECRARLHCDIPLVPFM